MISKRNKSDLAHGSHFPMRLIWPESKLTTKLEWRSDAEKWPDLHQQIKSWTGTTADPQWWEAAENFTWLVCAAKGWYWVDYRAKTLSPELWAGASGLQTSLVLTSQRSTLIRENTWQVTAHAFFHWSYIYRSLVEPYPSVYSPRHVLTANPKCWYTLGVGNKIESMKDCFCKCSLQKWSQPPS